MSIVVQQVAEELFDLADNCKDRRARWLLRGSVFGLFCANIAFVSMASAAVSGRALIALVAFAISVALIAVTAAAVIAALWIAIPDDKKPKHAFMWALLAISIIVAIPAPILLLAVGVLAFIYWRRRRSHRYGD